MHSQNDLAHSLRPIAGVSHVKGRTDFPLIEGTIPQILAKTVSQYPHRDAAIFCQQNKRYTYAQFATAVDDLAAGFLALGLQKGDRIGIWSPNRAEWLLTQFATARIGLVLVTINPAYRLSEVEYALNKVECKALVTAASFKSSNYIEMLQTIAPEMAEQKSDNLRLSKLTSLRAVVVMGDDVPAGMIGFESLMERGEARHKLALDGITSSLHENDPINIQFTSGTTGAPKGATLTHRNIINNGHFVTQTIALNYDDRLCIPVPLYHCFGMVMGTLGAVSKGAAMVFPSEAFEAKATLRAISDNLCTALYGVPTMFVAMLENPELDSFSLTQLRTGIMAGAPCPIEVMKRVNGDMHMQEVTIAYGMTETSPVSFQSAVDDPTDRRVSTVGRVHPHVEVKIIDENGKTVPIGVRGELCTRGYSVMRGYWGDDARTRESIDVDGWMHSGDLATIDSEGYCEIVGRVKDMVIRGGENIYPREVEEFLYTHELVSEVQVFGVPDEKYGEELCAWIVLMQGATLDEATIKAYCKGQIAHYKTPRFIRFVDELPMTVTGKPQKFIMRDKMIEELAL